MLVPPSEEMFSLLHIDYGFKNKNKTFQKQFSSLYDYVSHVNGNEIKACFVQKIFK